MSSPVPRSYLDVYGQYPAGTLQAFWPNQSTPYGAFTYNNGGQNRGYQRRSLKVSAGHRQPYTKGGGGNFLQVRFDQKIETRPMECWRYLGANQWQRWQGYPTAVHNGPSEPVMPTWDATSALLEPWGSKGWNRARPLKPVVSLSQFFGELHQLPKIPGHAIAQAIRRGTGAAGARRAFGSEYLNVDFGVRPLLDDLRKILNFEEEFMKAMAQAARDENRGVRRRRTLLDTTSTTVQEVSQNGAGYMYHPFAYLAGTKSGRITTTTTSEKIWFVGKFRYKLPDYRTPEGMQRLRRYFQGSHLRLSTAWELLPWSWMADWFTNVGEVLATRENQNAINVVAEYAYVMRTYEVITDSHCWVMNSTGGSTSHQRTHYVIKSRLAAIPYGFGSTWTGLSDNRIATLAALGMQTKRW